MGTAKYLTATEKQNLHNKLEKNTQQIGNFFPAYLKGLLIDRDRLKAPEVTERPVKEL